MIYGFKNKKEIKYGYQIQKLSKLLMELFMEDVSDTDGWRSFDAGVLDSMGTVELIVEIENRFDIRCPCDRVWSRRLEYS